MFSAAVSLVSGAPRDCGARGEFLRFLLNGYILEFNTVPNNDIATPFYTVGQHLVYYLEAYVLLVIHGYISATRYASRYSM